MGVFDGLLGGLVGNVGTMLFDSFTGYSDRKNKEAYNQQVELMNHQQDLAKDMTEFNNKQSIELTKQMPSAEVTGMMNAGLNPAMIQGGVQNALSSPAQSPSGQLSFNPIDTALKSRELDIQSMIAQAQVKKLESETEGQDIDNKWKDVLNDLQADKLTEERWNIYYNSLFTNEVTKGHKLDNFVKDKTKEFAVDLAKWQTNEQQFKSDLTMYQSQIAELDRTFSNETLEHRKAYVELYNQLVKAQTFNQYATGKASQTSASASVLSAQAAMENAKALVKDIDSKIKADYWKNMSDAERAKALGQYIDNYFNGKGYGKGLGGDFMRFGYFLGTEGKQAIEDLLKFFDHKGSW